MKTRNFLALILFVILATSCGSKYSYESVAGDPLQTRIYTLDNGLKVYLNVNKETPRIQTYIAVRVGGKNDPAQTTGLAHYFEHLMFKGTQKFGTQDYEAEKPMLDSIEALFEIYRNTEDENARKAIYARIDSISYEASKIAIPNEYDKLMAAIGADGTNAYTSYDQTVYEEDIPANQVENWLKIEADRFQNCVVRGFHTELETIYEEKNMSLTKDSRKVTESMLNSLFPNHPYGTQTVLGTQEHLKNPSITNVKNYHKTYYVPNNMAICMSGDLNPDKTIRLIDKYFGGMQPNPELPVLEYEKEAEITRPVVREVYGLESEYVSLGWRLDGASSSDNDMMALVNGILYNGMAGLIDLDINQKQKALNAFAYYWGLADYGMLMMGGDPKQGQSLDEVRDLLLAEVAKLRAGDFDEQLLKAVVDNYKLSVMQDLDSNEGRADLYVNTFVNGIDWKNQVTLLDRLSEITKQDVVDFANAKLRDDNYAIVYKRQGADPNVQKIAKPEITPIVTNRDAVSDFLTEITNTEVEPIEPVFLDFDRDMSRFTAESDIPVLYKRNETTDLFTLTYLYEFGTNNDPIINIASDYLDYLGTADMSAEDLAREFYNIACSFSISAGDERMSISISGLSENMDKAIRLAEKLMTEAAADEAVLQNLKADIRKSRADSKHNQNANFNRLTSYAIYGEPYVKASVLSDEQLSALTSAQLLDKIKSLLGMQHRVLYYGPMPEQQMLSVLNENHRVPEVLAAVDEKVVYPAQQTPENKVLVAQYDAKQIYYLQYSNRGEKYDAQTDAVRSLYNSYFGGGMNAIVFQEMREARGLAYSAWAVMSAPNKKDRTYNYRAFIATQNDKMPTAIRAFDDIINDMPRSEAAFDIAKESVLAGIRTQRITKASVLYSYLTAEDLGIDYDRRRNIYETVPSLTLDDVQAFQQQWVKDRKYTYCILGDAKDLDMEFLRTLGPVEIVSQKTIFGY